VLAWRIGDLTKTASELQQLLIQRDESRQPILLCRLALVDAYRGDPEAARNKIINAASQPQPPGIRSEVQFVAGCLALLDGDAEGAWTVLSKVAADLEASGYREPSHPPILPAAIEAATAVGDLLAAEQLCTRLEADSAALHSRFGAAAARRARGLIAQARGDTPTAEACLAGAAEAFDDLGVRLEAAHSYHKLGALLRRHGQRRRARNAFETAQEIYADCGAYGLANLATEELARIPGRAAAHTSELTESERRVAELVSNGMANKDVAQTLHVSVKTVETHLSRVFRKLGAANRTDLARRLAALGAHPIGLP
jgi:DNA-binding NarL/FixJ family response regulator